MGAVIGVATQRPELAALVLLFLLVAVVLPAIWAYFRLCVKGLPAPRPPPKKKKVQPSVTSESPDSRA